MTAIRVIQPSGASGSIQFASTTGDFASHPKLVFDPVSGSVGIGTSDPRATLHVSGTTMIEGPLVRADGSPFITDGDGITITTGSDGSINIRADHFESITFDEIVTTGSVHVGSLGGDERLTVNGMDITPYSGSILVPSGTTGSLVILDLASTFSGSKYATFNIDVAASSINPSTVHHAVVALYKLSVSMVRVGEGLEMVGVTELDRHTFAGISSSATPGAWDVDVDPSGSLFAATFSASLDTVWGAVVTKQTTLDIANGNLAG